jgi:sugar phosphate isomerase/epimerase
MPTLGFNLDSGFSDIEPRRRMRAIREAGFDDVMLSWDVHGEGSNGDFASQVSFALEAGLVPRTAHFPSSGAQALWAEGGEGEAYAEELRSAIRDCSKRGVRHLVMHLTRKLDTREPNPLGLERLARALRAAEEEGVDLAMENTRFLRYNAYCYANLASPRLKFCFDSGHAHCFTPGEDPLGRFGELMVTMHLSDNHGPGPGDCDEHLPIGMGNIDFDALFSRLIAYRPESYNLETSCPPADLRAGVTLERFLEHGYRSLADHVARAEETFEAGRERATLAR